MANRLAQDVRYGVRALARAPGFTAIALVVLSLGIGANATIFSFANAFFLRPLPVSDPGSIVRVCSNRYSTTRQRSYLEYRDRNSTLSGLAAFQMKSFGLLIDRETEHVFGEIVSGEVLLDRRHRTSARTPPAARRRSRWRIARRRPLARFLDAPVRSRA